MTKVVNMRASTPTKDDVYIGRKNEPFHFGNPFSHLNSDIASVHVGNRTEAIAAFRAWILGTDFTEVEPERRAWILENLESLRDKNLLCFCKPQKCHGDVYLELLYPPQEEKHEPSVWELMVD